MAAKSQLPVILIAVVVLSTIAAAAFLAVRAYEARTRSPTQGQEAAKGPGAPRTSGSNASSASAEASGGILGEWALTLTIEGYSLDYGLLLEGTPDALVATLVSPRSGKHPFKSASWKDGVLLLEIDREYRGTPVTFRYEGTATAGGELSGKAVPKGYEQYTGTWTARRKP